MSAFPEPVAGRYMGVFSAEVAPIDDNGENSVSTAACRREAGCSFECFLKTLHKALLKRLGEQCMYGGKKFEQVFAKNSKGDNMQNVSNSVLDALFQRRSIRKFTGKTVSVEDLTIIAEALRWAPSGGNRQPCRVLFLKKGDPRREAVAAFSKYAGILNDADVVAVVVLDKEVCYDAVKDCQVGGAGLQNMLLAVHALGLGAVWIGDIVSVGAEVLAASGLSVDALQFMALVAIGHPAEEGSPKRKPLTHYLLETL